MKSFFLGKIYLYYLNSITDAYLSRRLIGYVRDELSLDKLDKRLIELLDLYEIKSKEEIMGCAYTYYFWNGFYDFMYARWFEKILGKYLGEELVIIKSLVLEYRKELKMEYAYIEFEKKKIVLLTPLLQILSKKLYLFEYFVERNELGQYKNIPRKNVVTAMKKVQRANILSNVAVAEKLSSFTPANDLKVDYIIKGSKEVSDSISFVDACNKTLKSASRWDRWFVHLLNYSFGKD
jgi:hypothetical protein